MTERAIGYLYNGSRDIKDDAAKYPPAHHDHD